MEIKEYSGFLDEKKAASKKQASAKKNANKSAAKKADSQTKKG